MESTIASKLSPDDPTIQSNYLFSLNYSIEHSPQEVLQEHIKWGRQYADNVQWAELKPSKRFVLVMFHQILEITL
jgi:hypothetical protein